MDPLSLVEFPDAEETYRAWVRTHPRGFVVNAWKIADNKPQSTRTIMWHHASCGYISPDWPQRHVTGDTIKACSLNPAALAIWAKSRSEALLYCTDCHNAWLREQKSDQPE